MPGTEIPQGLAAAAANPATDQETLRQIAFHYPQLRAAVAANPSSYQGLLDWLAALGEPAVNEALAERARWQSAPDRTVVLPVAQDPSGAGGDEDRPPVFAPSAVGAPGAQRSAAAGETPAQGLFQADGAAPQPPRKGATGTKVALALLIVAALVLLGLVIGIFTGFFGGGDEAAQSTSSASSSPTTASSPSQTAQSSESASPEASPTATPEVKYPAPEGAVLAQSFQSPSGNILCDLGADVATCMILEQDYAANGFETCPEGVATMTLVATADGAGTSCGSAVSGQGGALAYGSAATNGHSACVSTEDGVSCWNTISGKAFALARGGWQTGSSGQITPDQFRW